jgi:ANTAR domain
VSGETTPSEGEAAPADGIVVRRSARGWQVGAEESADLTSAMMLADLLAADLGTPAPARVEQAIGVLAERHRLRPRQAFDLLRSVARSGGRRVIDIAENVVDSASNPLLPLPGELARKQPPARKRDRSPRHARARAAS